MSAPPSLDAPAISVLIGVRDGRLRAGTIESALSQSYRPIEVVVVDDGSRDGTPRIAKRYDEAITYVRQEALGISAARNRAVEASSGELLAFLDADDVFTSERLERMSRPLTEDAQLEAVFGWVTEFVEPRVPERSASLLRAPRERAPSHHHRHADPTLGVRTDRPVRHRAAHRRDRRMVRARALDAGLRRIMLDEVVSRRRLHGANHGGGRLGRRARAPADRTNVDRATTGLQSSVWERRRPPLSSPPVSVVIAVFNGERFLAEAIESVFAQHHRPLEVIVVDDGSTDGTADVARSFDDVILLRQGNEGPAAARNAGVARSSGEFITFLDADDRMSTGRIVTQLERLRAEPTVGCVLMYQEVVLEPQVKAPAWLHPSDDRDDVAGGVMMTAMLRRDTFLRVGGFDRSYRQCEDVDLLFRLRDAGTVIEILPAVGVHRRIHRDNVSHDVTSMRSALSRAVRGRLERQRVAAARGPV